MPAVNLHWATRATRAAGKPSTARSSSMAAVANPDNRFSWETDSIPESAAKWLADTVIANEVETRIGCFAHQLPVRIHDTAFGELPGVIRNDNVAVVVQALAHIEVFRMVFRKLFLSIPIELHFVNQRKGALKRCPLHWLSIG